MTPTVEKTLRDDPVLTVLGRIDNGAYTAHETHEDGVSNARYWKNALDRMLVTIVPDDAQLRATLQSRDEGKLGCGMLRDHRSAVNGTSTLPLAFAAAFV